MPRQPNPNRPYWASAIAEARLKAGLTQVELAKRINRPLTNVKKFETGERTPSFDTLYDIASVTGEPVYNLIDLDERSGGSTGFHEFVDPSFKKLLEYVDDDKIEFHNLADSGYTDNSVEIIDNKTYQSTICRKTELLLEVAKIKNKLKQKYEANLRKSVTAYIKKLLK